MSCLPSIKVHLNVSVVFFLLATASISWADSYSIEMCRKHLQQYPTQKACAGLICAYRDCIESYANKIRYGDIVISGSSPSTIPAECTPRIKPMNDCVAEEINKIKLEYQKKNLGDLSGLWKMTCVGSDETFKFDLTLGQNGNRIYGKMIRTDGWNPNTSVNGTISSDGKIDFMRTTGGWKQHYIGKFTKGSDGNVTSISGKFGDPGEEKLNWNAIKVK